MRHLAIAFLILLVTAPSALAQAGVTYQVPADNPFVGQAGAAPEVYVLGLRNPFRWSFDRQTGDMYIGDVGGGQREEVTFLPAAEIRAANLGWNCHEGTLAGPGNCSAPGHRPPQHEYPETNDPVVGGYVVRDPTLGNFQGRYIFARYGSGTIHWLGAGASGAVQSANEAIPQLTSFGEDGVGRLYASSQAGQVYRLTASGDDLGSNSIGNFTEPAAIAAPPGDPDRLFIAELGGHVKLRVGAQVHDFLDIDAEVETGGERGLLAVAVAPDYAVSGRVFVYYTDNAGDLRLDEVRRSAADPNQADPGTRSNLLTIEHSSESNHNGGQLQFGPEGYLYLSTGDGGGQGDPNGNAQNVGSLLGKVLRIDVGAPPAGPGLGADITAPVVSVRVPRRQRVLRLRGAIASVRCSESCTVGVGGTLRVGRRKLLLRRAARPAGPSARTRFKVRLRRRSARVLRSALRRGGRPRVQIRVRAVDAAGNRSALVRRTVRVRR